MRHYINRSTRVRRKAVESFDFWCQVGVNVLDNCGFRQGRRYVCEELLLTLL